LKGSKNAGLQVDSTEAFVRDLREDSAMGKKDDGCQVGAKTAALAAADADKRGKFLNRLILKKASPGSYIPVKLLFALGISILRKKEAANA
jgi:hypothetical protein